MIKVNILGPNYQSLEEFKFVCHATPAGYFDLYTKISFLGSHLSINSCQLQACRLAGFRLAGLPKS